ncbi:MAG: motility protein A [Nitrospirota bacterium]
MDIATILGIVSAFALMLISMSQGGGIGTFVDVPSLLIVVGGTIGATLITYPLKDVLKVISVVKNVFFNSSQSSNELIGTMVEFANKSRKEGILALEAIVKDVNDDFLKKGIQMLIDGLSLDVIRNVLDKEVEYLSERHSLGAEIFTTMGSLAPAFGMIGTLMGLVQMLQNLEDPSTIGPSMAMALITTFYGSVMANVLFLPMAGKLKTINNSELLIKELTIEGILAISIGLNPRVIEQKLNAFLSPKQRKVSE